MDTGIRPLTPHRHRALQRASAAWAAGRYHGAIEVLLEAGMTREERDAFVRTAHGRARQRTLRLLNR